MESIRSAFQLPDDLHYINCAYMSPQLRAVEEAGVHGLTRKRNPSLLGPDDFFDETEVVRQRYGQLINAPANRIAVIPSSSYGFSSALNNVPCKPGQHALTIQQEFPSDYFTLDRWSQTHQAEIRTISPDPNAEEPGRSWNTRILEAISADSALLIMSALHWMDGTRFDLKAISERCRETGTLLIIDGTQTVGALHIDLEETPVDALVCSAYKWLMGPYSIGLAYYGPAFDQGVPIEESWMNRTNAKDFSNLTTYEPNYKPAAGRYNVGETAHQVLMPMMAEALKHVLDWGTDRIQQHCGQLLQPLVDAFVAAGGKVAAPEYRANHLMGLRLPGGADAASLYQDLRDRKIVVSLRGDALRISPHLYNTEADIAALHEALAPALHH